MIRNGFTCRKVMVQSVYILNILAGQYNKVNGYTAMFFYFFLKGDNFLHCLHSCMTEPIFKVAILLKDRMCFSKN